MHAIAMSSRRCVSLSAHHQYNSARSLLEGSNSPRSAQAIHRAWLVCRAIGCEARCASSRRDGKSTFERPGFFDTAPGAVQIDDASDEGCVRDTYSFLNVARRGCAG